MSGILRVIREMDAECRFGQMARAMTASGRMAWPVAMAALYTQRAMFTRELGMRTKRMGLVFTLIIMAVGMKDNGLTINSMEKESRSGPMVLSTQANTLRV